MRAVVWHGYEDVRVDEVPRSQDQETTDAIVRVSSSASVDPIYISMACSASSWRRAILGHEPIGIVEEVGPEVNGLRAGDRVVIPFNIVWARPM
jgi:threonine dehydrogenase-like Zn-dependent dehydrogenase